MSDQPHENVPAAKSDFAPLRDQLALSALFLAVLSALALVLICFVETPTAASIREKHHKPAAAALYSTGACALGITLALALAAQFGSRSVARTARWTVFVATWMWIASIGLIRGWW